MRIRLFAERNAKEILSEPLYFIFGLGFPLVLLLLLSIINGSIPAEANNTMFDINNLAPGLAMFGTAFMALFSGTLIAKDRTSSFLMRLFASPMTATDFILGYTVPMVVMAAGQSTITFLVSLLFGLQFSPAIFLAIIVTVITSFLFIGLGLLCGTLLSDKSVGGICGALVTNLAGWLSGVFIPIDLIGGAFKVMTNILPFYHSVEAIKAALQLDLSAMLPHLSVVLAFTLVIYIGAIYAFKNIMKGDKA